MQTNNNIRSKEYDDKKKIDINANILYIIKL